MWFVITPLVLPFDDLANLLMQKAAFHLAVEPEGGILSVSLAYVKASGDTLWPGVSSATRWPVARVEVFERRFCSFPIFNSVLQQNY